MILALPVRMVDTLASKVVLILLAFIVEKSAPMNWELLFQMVETSTPIIWELLIRIVATLV